MQCKASDICNSHKACSSHLEHIAHESLGMGASRGVNDECNHGWEARCKSLCDNSPRSRPGEDLNLARSVNNDILQRRVAWLLTKADHLYSDLSHVTFNKETQNGFVFETLNRTWFVFVHSVASPED